VKRVDAAAAFHPREELSGLQIPERSSAIGMMASFYIRSRLTMFTMAI
jgi:hypothetical protein